MPSVESDVDSKVGIAGKFGKNPVFCSVVSIVRPYIYDIDSSLVFVKCVLNKYLI